ncbi:hypothetical protein ZWY2020_009036 [Hordeum vulgare]|nr:hypothetical protein ZWY2020_009036 [Hordeum vulgare]
MSPDAHFVAPTLPSKKNPIRNKKRSKRAHVEIADDEEGEIMKRVPWTSKEDDRLEVLVDPARDESLIFELLDLKGEVEDGSNALWFSRDVPNEQDVGDNLFASYKTGINLLKGCLYQGGVWKVRVELLNAYPYGSLPIGFVNKIYHPNVDELYGSFCLDVINQTWSPMFDLVNVFEVFLPQLLLYPNPSHPLNGEAAAFLMRDRPAYEKKVKDIKFSMH